MEHLPSLLEDDMEVPAASERPDRRLDAEAFTADDLDFYWSVGAFGVCGWYSG